MRWQVEVDRLSRKEFRRNVEENPNGNMFIPRMPGSPGQSNKPTLPRRDKTSEMPANPWTRRRFCGLRGIRFPVLTEFPWNLTMTSNFLRGYPP
ncbi:Hypothetical protein NTJ_13053 [Nesidiocoris tenuis]|uniref:Uncharacterized protein n=1 Tax=Nesidiocoris tenuis TaxID=355587 RepID=A0ABN7B766_9HEMI|nr:Hypothetical protein NTJ_13053 [Nesidiocoris tenuis]